MKRGVQITGILIVSILVGFFIWLVFFLASQANIVSFSPGVLNIPINCSNATMKSLWDSEFTKSYSGVTYLTDDNSTRGTCNEYIAFKNETNLLYIFKGGLDLSSSSENKSTIEFYRVKLDPAKITALLQKNDLSSAKQFITPILTNRRNYNLFNSRINIFFSFQRSFFQLDFKSNINTRNFLFYKIPSIRK